MSEKHNITESEALTKKYTKKKRAVDAVAASYNLFIIGDVDGAIKKLDLWHNGNYGSETTLWGGILKGLQHLNTDDKLKQKVILALKDNTMPILEYATLLIKSFETWNSNPDEAMRLHAQATAKGESILAILKKEMGEKYGGFLNSYLGQYPSELLKAIELNKK